MGLQPETCHLMSCLDRILILGRGHLERELLGDG
jgi:hypothetical protein